MNLKVSGTMENFRAVKDSTRFKIIDKIDRTYGLWVNIGEYVNSSDYFLGAEIDVYGTLYCKPYPKTNCPLEIQMENLLDANSLDNYTNCRISEIIDNPDLYVNKKIAIQNVIITETSKLIGSAFNIKELNRTENHSVNCIIYNLDAQNRKELNFQNSTVTFYGCFSYYAQGCFWQISTESSEHLRLL